VNVSFDFNFWTVLLFVLNFGLALWVQLANRKKAEADQLKSLERQLNADIRDAKTAHEQRLERHSQKISRLESQMENAIGDDDIKAVHKRVDEILEKSSTMAGQLQMLIESTSEIRKIMMQRGNHGG